MKIFKNPLYDYCFELKQNLFIEDLLFEFFEPPLYVSYNNLILNRKLI